MFCEWCINGIIGQKYLIGKVNWACCKACNADTTHLYPRLAIFEGKNEERQHLFLFIESTTCPLCGAISEGCTMNCPDEGILLILKEETVSEQGN